MEFPPRVLGSGSVKVCQDPFLACPLVKVKGGKACTGVRKNSFDAAWDYLRSFGMLIVIFSCVIMS